MKAIHIILENRAEEVFSFIAICCRTYYSSIYLIDYYGTLFHVKKISNKIDEISL